jgi:hypothetical protein
MPETDRPAEWKCPVCQRGPDACDCSDDVITEAQARLDAGADPVVDASNPAQVAQRVKAQKRGETQDRDDLNWVMRHEQGRRIMWRLLEACSVFGNSFVRAQGDPHLTAFNCGEQNIGLSYLSRVVAQEPDGYNLMVKENSGRLK